MPRAQLRIQFIWKHVKFFFSYLSEITYMDFREQCLLDKIVSFEQEKMNSRRSYVILFFSYGYYNNLD